MSQHDHPAPKPICAHLTLRYCQPCDVVYCTVCDREWGILAHAKPKGEFDSEASRILRQMGKERAEMQRRVTPPPEYPPYRPDPRPWVPPFDPSVPVPRTTYSDHTHGEGTSHA